MRTTFDPSECQNLKNALSKEWLETNGLGGFASSTIIGLNTRRYHGLLVAATKPPVGRLVLLSKLEETLFIDGRPFDLSANRYPGVVHPQGFRYLKQFRLDPFPVFTYEVEGIEIESARPSAAASKAGWRIYRIANATGSTAWWPAAPISKLRTTSESAPERSRTTEPTS